MSLLWFEYPREAKKDYVSLLGSLRTQMTFCNTTACLPVKRRLRNECRNSILFYTIRHYHGFCTRFSDIFSSGNQMQNAWAQLSLIQG